MRFIFVFIHCLLFSLASLSQEPAPSVEERISDLETQLSDLEQRHNELHTQWIEGAGTVSSFFQNHLHMGGFIEHAITHIEGPDTESQTSANSNILGINLTAEWSHQFYFVSQVLAGLTYQLQNIHNNPNLIPPTRQFGQPSFGTLVAQAYAEYRANPQYNLQIGMGYVPFGLGFQNREPFLFERRNGPQMINSTGANNTGAAFPLWMGFHLHGLFTMEKSRSGYNFYSFTPFTNPKTIGLGGRLWTEISEKISLGTSVQSAKEHEDNSFSHGFDVQLREGLWGLTTEYARNKVSGRELAVESYYVEPHYTLRNKNLVFYLVADYLDNPLQTALKGTTFIADPFKRWGYGGGLNWLPITYLRFRLGYLSYQYLGETASINGQQRDFQWIDFSMGAAF